MEESKQLLSSGPMCQHCGAARHDITRPSLISRLSCYITAGLLVASLMINIFIIVGLRKQLYAETTWSPAIDGIPARRVRFNETYYYTNQHPSIYAGNSSAADAAWERFVGNPMINGLNATLAVSPAVLLKLAPQYGHKWMKSAIPLYRNGEKKYMASLDIFHQMHCLSFFRAMIYEPKQFYGNPHFVGHQEHCLQAIREALMCNAGNGLTVYHWMEDQIRPYPEFNTYHVCRDPEEVLEWALRNSVPIHGYLRKPAEATVAADPFLWRE